MMARRKGWELRLAAEIEAALAKPFQWGVFDCFLFAADCAKAMTGQDVAAPLRGRYSTAEGAVRAALRFLDLDGPPRAAGQPAQRPAGESGAPVEAVLAKILGAPIAVAFAQRGDVVTFDVPELGIAAGVVAMNGVEAHVAGPEGVRRVPLRLARNAWRVG